MTEIIPAILPNDFEDVENQVSSVNGLVSTVQIDICDGHFVPSFTWPYRKHDENFEAILREERGLPFWEDIDYEIDLMVANPSSEVDRWTMAGASRIIVHIESARPEEIVEIIKKSASLVEIGIAINIATSLTALEMILSDKEAGEKVAFIQCMGIDKIGFQGQTFDSAVLQKIRGIHKAYPDIPISVDGGVNLDSAKELLDAGATRLVIGSAIFTSSNIPETIHTFQNIR